MGSYRVYILGSDGRFEDRRDIDCDTDELAIVQANRIVGNRKFEIWQDARLVSMTQKPPAPEAA
jgi:hypothetical protein